MQLTGLAAALMGWAASHRSQAQGASKAQLTVTFSGIPAARQGEMISMQTELAAWCAVDQDLPAVQLNVCYG